MKSVTTSKTPLFFLMLLLISTTIFMAISGCGNKNGEAKSTNPALATAQSITTAARQANLANINLATHQYYMQNKSWPDDIKQLSRYFPKGLPKDPSGGTYYIVRQNGEALAAVK